MSNNLYMRKLVSGSYSVVSTEEEWGVYCQESPYVGSMETQEPYTQEWAERSGEEVYLPSGGLPVKGFDCEFKLIIKGTSLSDMKEDLYDMLEWLRTAAGEGVDIYEVHTGRSFCDCYLKSVDDEAFYNDGQSGSDKILQFNLTMHCCSPLQVWNYSS